MIKYLTISILFGLFLCGRMQGALKVSDIYLVQDKNVKIICLHVTLTADKSGGAFMASDLFDPSGSIVVKNKQTGEIIPNYGGGGDPGDSLRSFVIPPGMTLTFVVGLPNNKLFDKKLMGEYELSVKKINGISIIVYYDKNGILLMK